MDRSLAAASTLSCAMFAALFLGACEGPGTVAASPPATSPSSTSSASSGTDPPIYSQPFSGAPSTSREVDLWPIGESQLTQHFADHGGPGGVPAGTKPAESGTRSGPQTIDLSQLSPQWGSHLWIVLACTSAAPFDVTLLTGVAHKGSAAGESCGGPTLPQIGVPVGETDRQLAAQITVSRNVRYSYAIYLEPPKLG